MVQFNWNAHLYGGSNLKLDWRGGVKLLSSIRIASGCCLASYLHCCFSMERLAGLTLAQPRVSIKYKRLHQTRTAFHIITTQWRCNKMMTSAFPYRIYSTINQLRATGIVLHARWLGLKVCSAAESLMGPSTMNSVMVIMIFFSLTHATRFSNKRCGLGFRQLWEKSSLPVISSTTSLRLFTVSSASTEMLVYPR